jgi:hypothetical protein
MSIARRAFSGNALEEATCAGLCNASVTYEFLRLTTARIRLLNAANLSIQNFVSRIAFAIPLQIEGLKLPISGEQGDKVPNSRDIEQDSMATLLDSVGGDPLFGSGFETEKPDAGFSVEEAVWE